MKYTLMTHSLGKVKLLSETFAYNMNIINDTWEKWYNINKRFVFNGKDEACQAAQEIANEMNLRIFVAETIEPEQW